MALVDATGAISEVLAFRALGRLIFITPISALVAFVHGVTVETAGGCLGALGRGAQRRGREWAHVPVHGLFVQWIPGSSYEY